MAELTLTVEVAAEPAVVFVAMTDWEHQDDWMLGTTVRATHAGGQGVGGRFEARTGLGPIGFLDPMEITAWDPPWRCDVRHLGRLVRGTGSFRVEQLAAHRSRFVWSEQLDLPLGLLGRLGWVLVRPVFAAGVRRSLRRFATWAETRSDPRTIGSPAARS